MMIKIKLSNNAKCYLGLVVFFICCFIVKYGVKLYMRGYPIKWQDYALSMEIMRNTGYYEIYWSGKAKKSGRTMEIIGEDIHNLEDLRHFPSIERLYLRETSVVDLSPLKSLKKLEVLIIDGGKVRDLEALREVDTLTYIGLKNLPVTSIEPLSEMENLSRLSLSGLDLKEIPLWKEDALTILEMRSLPLRTLEAFRNEKNIGTIVIQDTKIEDVSALQSMSNLKYVTIKNSPIRNIPDLEGLTELVAVRIENTNIEELPALPDSLVELRLSDNYIRDFNFAKPLENLYCLEISNIPEGCTLGEMDFLKMCSNVRDLTLSNNRLQSLKGIRALDRLGRLDISQNEFENVKDIEEYEELLVLNLSDNPITDFSGIRQLKDLKELDVSGIDLSAPQDQEILSPLSLRVFRATSSKLNNLGFLKNSLGMEHLYLSDNRLQDIRVLTEMKRMIELDISDNPIADLTPLTELPIRYLDISGIDLKAINPEHGTEMLKMKEFSTLTASNCNIESFESINRKTFEIDVSDNHIRDFSISKKEWSFRKLDMSGTPVSEEDIKQQLDVTEIYPGIYLGPKIGDPPYYQIKTNKDSEFIVDIGHYEP